jgi:hypothetical protein
VTDPAVTVALVTAGSSLTGIVLAAFVTWFFGRVQAEKLHTIHMLVNSRLTEALNEIKELKHKLKGDVKGGTES